MPRHAPSPDPAPRPPEPGYTPILAGLGAGLEGLETFLAVAELGSFSEAAKCLHVSQPAVTARVQKLEAFLDVRLFHRTTRAIQLTEDGARLADCARLALRDLGGMVREFRRAARPSHKTRLAVASTPLLASFTLPPIAFRYLQRHPDVEIDIQDLRYEEALRAMEQGDCEIGVFALATPHARFDFTPLMRDDIVLIVPAGHPLATAGSATLAQIAGQPLMALRKFCGEGGMITREFQQHGLPFSPVATAVNHATLVGMFEAGLGLALLPRSMAQHNAREPRPVITLEDSGLHRHYGIVVARGAHLGTAASSFCAFLREQFGAQGESHSIHKPG